ncbi:MerR family transcriptional regulator [Candidatus Dependentiae bacterium]|nr:MerR family transcriptional regulator [Candidatus Dependentiae bacterium]
MDIKNIENKLNIPNKLFFSIREVSKILELNASVLRYWEKEFQIIQPKRNEFGHRQYRKNDVVLLGLIKELLYDKKFSIQGAKQEIKGIFSNKRKSSKGKDVKTTSPALSDDFVIKLDLVINSVEKLIQEIDYLIR